MVTNLKSEEYSEIETYLDLLKIEEGTLLYKRLNSYYIGEDEKQEIDINYPIYINQGDAIFNISEDTILITTNYEEVEGYPEFFLTGGIMYNGSDLTRADGNQYIFLKSTDGIYTNVEKIKITTQYNEYEIQEYSNIYFSEDRITYYQNNGDYMEYHRIGDIDNNSQVEINGQTSLTYKEFLEKLDLIDTEETESIETEENSEVNETTEETTNSSNDDSQTESETTEQEWQEGQWAKPEVSCTDFEGEVYTLSTTISIVDRAGVISKGIIFEIRKDGRLNRRVQVTSSGTLEITGMQPETEYQITGIVYYVDENGTEVEETFYTGTVTTKSIDTLGTIDFSFENGQIYSNKIELIHLKINNDINEEVIKGISRIQVEINGVQYKLSTSEVEQIKQGNEITYQTGESVTSNSTIYYEIQAFDLYGNELKEINNTGKTRTSKQAPSISIRATKQDVTEVNLNLTLTNKDDVELENYRYIILDASGEQIKSDELEKENQTLIFTDLDPSGYYTIIIYADYDLEDGLGTQQNVELGRGTFTTGAISTLGYMRLNIDEKELLTNEFTIGLSIDSSQTDARLIAILDKVEIVIYSEGKNTSTDDEETDDSEISEEVTRITLTDDQISALKIAEEIELNINKLTSNTIYKIDVITTVKQGTVEQEVENRQSVEEIITYKIPAEVQIRNQFVIGTMIDLDIRVEDLDGAVLTNNVRIEVRDEDNKLVSLEEMATNEDYERKTYEDLDEDETYTIIVYAPQYNEGSTNATYYADYVLLEIQIKTEAGISGSLGLLSLEQTPTGKNLINVASKVNWFERCFNNDYAYGISYDEDTKILTLGGTGNYAQRNFYDLSKYIGEEITISFYAKTDDETNLRIGEKSDDDFTNVNYTYHTTISDLDSEWKYYTYNLTLESTGYVCFSVPTSGTSVQFREFQIELGNTATSYEEFAYTLNANVNISVYDQRGEITTNDYYIRIYKNDEQVAEYNYVELGEEHKIENELKSYEVEADASYKIELLIKIQDRYYDLASQEFTTTGSEEIKGISSLNDFWKIQPEGTYIVLNDIDMSENIRKFGSSLMPFNGRIDFNGKTLTRDVLSSTAQMFHQFGSNVIIENIVFDLKINNNTEISLSGGLVYYNYGTIKNIQVNLIESTEMQNSGIQFISSYNYGTIEKFVINLQVNLYQNTNVGIVAGNNYGTIKNGYVYGENIKLINSTSITSSGGVIVLYNRQNAIIENVYSLVNIDDVYNSTASVANIVYRNMGNSTVQNVYSVDVGENITDLTAGPNVYQKTSTKVYNNYYFADVIFESDYETKGNKLSLWDANFQNQLINGDGAFIVYDLVNEGFYPQVDMSDVMPAQEYIELPEVEDADLVDILSTTVLEQGSDTVKVEFSVNNPSAEIISDIDIEYIDTEIVSQEYSQGKSTVVAILKNPVMCVSSYEVLSISTTGVYGTYPRYYETGERVIYVDLYNEIWSVTDWKNIANSTTENYMLMTDLDFINEGSTVSLSYVYGIINGNGYTISNINLTDGTNGLYLISNLYGTLENLYINNFNQVTLGSYGGLIGYARMGSIIDNVHLSNVNITVTNATTVGGIVGYAFTSTVKNCSVSNLEIATNINGTPSELYIGGIIGRLYSVSIENCYVQEIVINDIKAISSGIGGIAGHGTDSNSIINCYSEGKIISENANVGGIVGNIAEVNIENCYSKVNISTTNTLLGGIVGVYSGSSISNIDNNLSIGNMYTTLGIDAINRIVGSSSETSNNNYAYEEQLLNGYVKSDSKGATLLSEDGVLNLDLGDYYDYTSSSEGILPKLYNTEGTELLPNQQDIYLAEEQEVHLEIESITVEKGDETATITIIINNPNKVTITGITIEDMSITSLTTYTENERTRVEVKATPERYYDSYKLTEIKYKNTNNEGNQNTEEQIKEVEAGIDVQFYKEIYTYAQWQSIEEGTYQNYRLMADIDFSGNGENVKSNITVNRLEANSVVTLSNITLEFSEANTGLINDVKTSIKNIKFENITLTNTSSSGNYFGVIASNSGDIENLEFTNITIEASNLSYVGVIGVHTSGNIEGIKLEGIEIEATSYVGGLIGTINVSAETEINNITGNDIEIESTSNYIGGITGYQSGTNLLISNIKISGYSITGKDYTGGIVGYSYSGSLTNIEVEDTTINGSSYVGGVIGRSNEGTYDRTYFQIKNSTINVDGSYVGGIVGYVYNGTIRFWTVDNVEIKVSNPNSEYIGGLVGIGAWCTVNYFQVNELTIDGDGQNVGGILGGNFTNNAIHLQVGYIYNSTVKGYANVGGVIGNSRYSSIQWVYANVEVEASRYVAGGIVGYLDNSDMTASNLYTRIYDTMLLNSTVSAGTKAGGLFGDISTQIYRNSTFYYDIYIEADVTSGDATTSSLIIGGYPSENEYIDAYVYKYSKLNEEYVYLTSDNINEDQYLVRSDLEEQTTYTSTIGLSTTYFDFSKLEDGKYPTILDSYVYDSSLQVGVDLPTDPADPDPDPVISSSQANDVIGISTLGANIENNAEISEDQENNQTDIEITVYPVSVNEVNIEFSDISATIYFTYYLNGVEQEEISLTQKTYTIPYNYQDELEIQVYSKGEQITTSSTSATGTESTETTNIASLVISPEELKSTISLVGDTNAYLNGTTLYINGEAQEGEYVNLYSGYALTTQGQILNIETKTIETTTSSTDTSTEAKPLHTYTYGSYTIQTYGTYSTINGNIKTQIYNVRNGKLSAMSNNLNIKIDNYITDSYNGKEYQTILTTDGKLKNIKQEIQLPESFNNSNITQLVQNQSSDKTEAMVIYETGKVIVFNYVTGDIIYDNGISTSQGLLAYIQESISDIWSDYENMQIDYENSQKLVEKLKEMPIEKALEQLEIANSTQTGSEEGNTASTGNIENSSQTTNNQSTASSQTGMKNYITVYNSETNEYEIYSEDEILTGTDEEPVSETEKIKQYGLESLYDYYGNQIVENIDGQTIIIVTIVVILMALLILRKNISSRKHKSKKLRKTKNKH